MEPYAVFHTIVFKYISRALRLVAFNVIDPNFKVHLETVIVVALSISFELFSLYTCSFRVVETCTQSLTLALVGSQGLVKQYVVVTCLTELKQNVAFIFNMYKVNMNYGPNNDCLLKCARLNLIVSKIMVFMVATTICALCCMPPVIYWATGSVITIMPVRLPFVPDNTVIGYLAHSIYHFTLAVLASLGAMIGADLFILTFTMHIWPMTQILKHNVQHLNEEIRGRNGVAVTRSIWLRQRFRNILLMHREMDLYMRNLAKITFYISTFEVYANQLGLILLVYTTVALKWIPGLFLSLTLLFKLFCYCLIGTSVDMMNDATLGSLVNVECVMLPKHEKKLLLFMVHAAQRPCVFRAGFHPVNMSTFVEVIKTTYTFAMLLLETV